MHRWLAPRVVLPLYELVSGRRFWSELAQQRRLQWRPAAELEARALARIRALIRHAVTHVPLYRDLYRQAEVEVDAINSLEDLRRLPIVSKDILRDRPTGELTAENLAARRRVSCSTSGSTGTPLALWLDGAAADLHLAGFLLGLDWAGVSLWDLRVDLAIRSGQSWPSRLSSSSVVSVALRRWLLGQETRQLGTMGKEASQLVEELDAWTVGRDYYLRVYPSQAGQLAREMLERNLVLRRYPKAVISTSENLTAVNEAAISRAFRCPVVNHYSCWEALHLAQSCPDRPECFHVNSELAHLRVVRDDGSAADPGESGRILLTSLTNEVMPLINYELGDRGALGEPCPCGRGFPTLARLDGRGDELVLGADGGFLSPIVLNQLPVLGRAAEYVREYQLLETEAGSLVVHVVPTSRFGEPQAEAIRRGLRELVGEDRKIFLETVSDISREASGKRLVIKRSGSSGDGDV
jgi:phenylacetate-CoA ligase